jgi:hypothetical protein
MISDCFLSQIHRILFFLFFLIKISYLECMFNFRAPWHVLLLFEAINARPFPFYRTESRQKKFNVMSLQVKTVFAIVLSVFCLYLLKICAMVAYI